MLTRSRLDEIVKAEDLNALYREVRARSIDDALCIVVSFGHTNAVEYLLKAGADIHTNQDEPIFLAAKNGHVEIAEILLDAGANPSVRDCLHTAYFYHHAEIMNLLLAAGCTFALHLGGAKLFAERNKHLDIVAVLNKYFPENKDRYERRGTDESKGSE